MPHLTLTLQIRSKKKTLPATAVQRSVSNYEGLFLPLHHKIPLEVIELRWLMQFAQKTNPHQTAYRATNHLWQLSVMQEQSQELSTHFVSAYCSTSSMQHFFQIWLFIVCLDCRPRRPKQTNHDHLTYLLLQSCGIPLILL